VASGQVVKTEESTMARDASHPLIGQRHQHRKELRLNPTLTQRPPLRNGMPDEMNSTMERETESNEITLQWPGNKPSRHAEHTPTHIHTHRERITCEK